MVTPSISITMSTIKRGKDTSSNGELIYQNQSSRKRVGQQAYSGQMEISGINEPHPSGMILLDSKEYFLTVQD